MSAQALIEGEPVSVMTMVWQLLHLKLIKPVSVHAHPELFSLVMPGEEDAVVPEELLLRWLNHHLRLANRPEQARAWSMSEVLRNGVGVAVVLHEVAPPAAGASLAPLSLPDATARAAAVVSELKRLGVADWDLYPEDLTSGNARVALVVAAAIFDQYPHVEIKENRKTRDEAQPRADPNQTLDSQVDALGQRMGRAAPHHARTSVALPSHHGMIDEVVEHHAYSLPQIMEIRNAVYPVAVHLCRLFGFQMEHTHAGEAVPSSMDNEVDHVSSLLKNTMDRNKGDNKGYRTAISKPSASSTSRRSRTTRGGPRRSASASRARRRRRSWATTTSSRRSRARARRRWARSPPTRGTRPALFRFETAEEEMRWLCHAQLHQLVLWYLIWGEAANLRHAPELLCFLFHLTANAIRLPQTTPPTSTEGTRKYVFRGSMLPMPPMDFLDSIVTPIYAFLRTEVSERQNDAIGTRTMYDDVNETFWLQDRLALILPKELWKVAGSGSLHGTLAEKDIRAGFAFVRDLFKPAKKVVTKKGEAARELSRFFGKTYCEMTTWLNVFPSTTACTCGTCC